MTRLLAAVDAGPVAGRVLATAAALVPFMADEVTVVCCDGARSAAHALAAVSVESLEGPAAPSLVAAAAADDVTGIVIGVRSMPGGPRPAGHVAGEVLVGASVPVVAVPPPPHDGTGEVAIERLLVPLEGTTALSDPAAALIRRFEAGGAAVDLLHVFDRSTRPSFWDGWDDEQLWRREFTRRHAPVADGLQVLVGDVAQQILVAVDRLGSSLVLLEWNRVLADPAHAHVVRDLLANSPVPLLLMPAEPDRAPTGSASAPGPP